MNEPDESLLDEHLAAENAHDLERIMATYTASPVITLNSVHIEGLAAVREFHRGFGFGGDPGSFSDVHVAERRRYSAADAVVRACDPFNRSKPLGRGTSSCHGAAVCGWGKYSYPIAI